MAKVVKHVKAHKKPATKAKHEAHDALPIDDEPLEPLIPPYEPAVESIPDDVVTAEEHALGEAYGILVKLAQSSAPMLGSAHGLALIQAAKDWLASHVAEEES
jgi:hypothetical protein